MARKTPKQPAGKPTKLNDEACDHAVGGGAHATIDAGAALKFADATLDAGSADAAIKDGTSNTFLVGERNL